MQSTTHRVVSSCNDFSSQRLQHTQPNASSHRAHPGSSAAPTSAVGRKPIRTAIATVCLSGILEEKMAAIADAGFDGFEMCEEDLIGCPLTPAQICRRAAGLGIAIDLYQPFRNLDTIDAEQFRRNLARAQRKFDVMQQLGVTTLLVCSSVLPSAVSDDRLLVDQLGCVADLALRQGIFLAYEALAWGTHVNTYGHAWDIVRQVDHPALGTCLDSFHILARGDDLDGIADIPHDKIFYVQLADAPYLSLGVLPWSRHHRCFPGQGEFDLTSFATQLLSSGYHGPWSLEVFNDEFRRTCPKRTAKDGHRSLLYLQEQVARVAARYPRVQLFSAPRPALVAEVASLALSAPPHEAKIIGQTLHQLGFGLTKPSDQQSPVTRSHGEISITVESQLSLPALPVLAHIGIRCDDVSDWGGRAAALGVSTQTLRTARRAVDDAIDVVRLKIADGAWFDLFDRRNDEHWRSRDDALGAPRSKHETSLTGVDHFSLVIPEKDRGEAVLLLRSLFGMTALPAVDITDPTGLRRKQALTLEDGQGSGLRIILETVPTSAPSVASPVQPRLGRVGHIAFGTEDILAAAEHMRRGGFRVLPSPANYYDDLAARFDMRPSQLSWMSRYGVLYDRDAAGGEFYHFHTEPIGEDFFFEVVQRIGGYTGYGEVNASTRCAAQLRSRNCAFRYQEPAMLGAEGDGAARDLSNAR